MTNGEKNASQTITMLQSPDSVSDNIENACIYFIHLLPFRILLSVIYLLLLMMMMTFYFPFICIQFYYSVVCNRVKLALCIDNAKGECTSQIYVHIYV